jgi:hypothetical protein
VLGRPKEVLRNIRNPRSPSKTEAFHFRRADPTCALSPSLSLSVFLSLLARLCISHLCAFERSDCAYKIVLVGDSGVGKSNIMMRFSDDYFSENYISTIDVDFKVRIVQRDSGKCVKLQLWVLHPHSSPGRVLFTVCI